MANPRGFSDDIQSIVDKATHSRQAAVNPDLLLSLKSLCKISDDNVRLAFDAIFDKFLQPNSQVGGSRTPPSKHYYCHRALASTGVHSAAAYCRFAFWLSSSAMNSSHAPSSSARSSQRGLPNSWSWWSA
jgi:hypothetical protein